MSRLLKLMSLTAFVGAAFLLFSPVAHAAFDPFEDTCDGSSAASSSSVCKDKNINAGKDPTDPITGIIPKVANIIAAVGGIIAVVMIMVNGVTLIMSTGDSAKINKARDGIIYAAVGIVIIVMARVIVAFILRFV